MLNSRQLSPAAAPDLSAAAGAALLEHIPDVHVLDRLAVGFKHIRLIGGVFAVVVAIGMLESYSSTPMYRTQARIVIQDERSTAVANLNTTELVYWQDPEPYFNTQYRILQSRGLARRVVRKMPPPPVPAPSTISRAFSLPRQMIKRWRTPPTTQSELPAADETVTELAAIGAFLGGVEIIPVKGTRLVEIAYTASDAQYAAPPPNTLAREYVQQNLDLKLANTTATITWLGEELGKQRGKVEAAERAMAEYQEGQNAMSLDDRQNIVIPRLNSLNAGG